MNGLSGKYTAGRRSPDLSGQRFGMLSVVERRPTDGNGTAMWLCRCDCGKEMVASGSRMLRGTTQSCGCLVATNSRPATAQYWEEHSLIGDQFGALTVLAKCEFRERNSIVWECVCRCSKPVFATTNQLKKSIVVGCGCVNRRDVEINNPRLIMGARTGALVVESTGIGQRGGRTVTAKCDCGNSRVYKSWDFPLSRRADCGCGIAKHVKKVRPQLSDLNKTLARLTVTYRKGANARNIAWELTPDQVAELAMQDCTYCGAKPAKRRGREMLTPVNGIDRMDSSRGYVIDNCAPCCSACNYVKNDTPFDDFLAWVRRVAIHTGVCK